MINQNQVAAKFMTDQGYKTFAIIHDITDYGKSHKDYFTQFITELGGKVIETFGVTPDQQDFTAELTKIKSLHPDVIYFGGLVPVGVRVRSQMEKLGIDAQFEGVSGIKSDAFVTGVGNETAEGSLSFIEGVPLEKMPGGDSFMKSYKDHGYAESPEAYGPFAYASMKLTLDTIESTGPNREKITEALSGSIMDLPSEIATRARCTSRSTTLLPEVRAQMKSASRIGTPELNMVPRVRVNFATATLRMMSPNTGILSASG